MTVIAYFVGKCYSPSPVDSEFWPVNIWSLNFLKRLSFKVFCKFLQSLITHCHNHYPYPWNLLMIFYWMDSSIWIKAVKIVFKSLPKISIYRWFVFLRNSYFYLFETTYLILTKISLQSFKKNYLKKNILKVLYGICYNSWWHKKSFVYRLMTKLLNCLFFFNGVLCKFSY